MAFRRKQVDTNWRSRQRARGPGDLGIDVNRTFHYIVTEWGGLCTVQELADGLKVDAAQIPEFVVKNGTRMKLVKAAFPENALVIATIFAAQICTFNDRCENPNCHFFHLCKDYVTDSCGYGDHCRNSHDIKDAHNRRVLQSSGLSEYDEDNVLQVIRNSQPEVCLEYNQPSGCKTKQKGDACHKFHVCHKYVKGKCLSPNCKMDHDLSSPHNVMIRACLPKNDKKLMKMMLYEDDQEIDLGAVAKLNVSGGLGGNVPRKPICHHNIERTCRYEKKKCKFDHRYSVPYMWCINLNDNWYPMEDVNERIECAFSQPEKKTVVVSPKIGHELENIISITVALNDMKFPLMTCPVEYTINGEQKLTQVVRLSTKSYVQDVSFTEKKGKDGFVTVWMWFWKDNDGWKMYGAEGNPPHQDGIESQFLAKSEEIEFNYGRFSYTLHLQKGYQENKELGTKREVRRRPVFVSERNVKQSAYPSMPVRTCDPKAIKLGKTERLASGLILPDGWRAMDSDSLGFDLVSVPQDSQEYKEVKQHFFKTIPASYRITEIQRVQNPLLYKGYTNCKADLKLKYKGGHVEERDLFHGTRSEETTKSICFQGFDPRIHAVTAYGKGAYFARDASYSDRYTDKACCMFRGKVLIGKYVDGDSSMQRPPTLPDSTYELYDSTVNSKSDPTIFVVYDKNQCYPSHLIKYSRK